MAATKSSATGRDALFDRWSEAYPEAVRGGFHRDGIVHEPTWNLEQHRRLGITAQGPHRAELKIRLNEERAKGRASRGQQKMLITAMILAQAELLIHRGVVAPIELHEELVGVRGAGRGLSGREGRGRMPRMESIRCSSAPVDGAAHYPASAAATCGSRRSRPRTRRSCPARSRASARPARCRGHRSWRTPARCADPRPRTTGTASRSPPVRGTNAARAAPRPCRRTCRSAPAGSSSRRCSPA